MFENNVGKCKATVIAGTYISIYLIVFFAIRLIHSSVREEWQHVVSLSIERVATLKVGFRRSIQGALMLASICCGAFLFALMSADYGKVR